jgi:2-methylcitrate dehydratase PrpD
VAVTLKDGTTVRTRVDQPRGGPDRPLTWDELVAKYRDCAVRVIGSEATEVSLRLIGELERLSAVSDLTRLVAGRQTVAAV